MKNRVVFFDYLRAFVILLVVLHHAMQAYTTYAQYNPQNYVFSPWPVADGLQSYAFDLVQRFQDMYFMSLMFLVAGLFTWPSLTRKGAAVFLKDRLIRLGIPFAVGVTVLAPIGEYACYRLTGHGPGFLFFWQKIFFANYWYSGPVWFLWVLLAFSILGAILRAVLPGAIPGWFAIMARLSEKPVAFAAVLFGLTFAVTAVPFAVLPYTDLRAWSYWMAPFWVQINRAPLYALYYFIGVAAGAPGVQSSRVFARDSPLAAFWPVWALLALAFYFASAFFPRNIPHAFWILTSSGFFAGVCSFTCLALLGFFASFMDRPSRFWDSFSENAYGIYLIHFPVVVWLQVGMMGMPVPVFVKFAVVAVLGFLGSYLLSALLRTIPAVRRVL